MESFETFFSLKLAYRVFSAAEQFSINLRAKYTTVSEDTRGANLLRSHYVSLRWYTAFIDFYKNVLDSSEGLTEDPLLPRCRKVPGNMTKGARGIVMHLLNTGIATPILKYWPMRLAK